MNFDPFQNRLCRNIRNELSESMVKSIETGDIGPSHATARKYLSDDPEQLKLTGSYIHSRLARYQTVLSQIQLNSIRVDEIYKIAILLWDEGLFFEVHEWLEERWHASEGLEKKVIQILIRAAGTYVHLEFGRMDAARKIGEKALTGLKKHKASVPNLIDVNLLIEKIKTLDPVPPKFGEID